MEWFSWPGPSALKVHHANRHLRKDGGKHGSRHVPEEYPHGLPPLRKQAPQQTLYAIFNEPAITPLDRRPLASYKKKRRQTLVVPAAETWAASCGMLFHKMRPVWGWGFLTGRVLFKVQIMNHHSRNQAGQYLGQRCEQEMPHLGSLL